MPFVSVHARDRRCDVGGDFRATGAALFFVAVRFPVRIASLRFKMATFNVAYRLDEDGPQFEVDRNIIVRREIFRTLHRIDVCFREDILRAQAFEQNRIQPLFGKREEPLPVFGKGGGKSLLLEIFHVRYFTMLATAMDMRPVRCDVSVASGVIAVQ